MIVCGGGGGGGGARERERVSMIAESEGRRDGQR